ncbi:hypothetical protein GN316_00880 [Xylophilus sp. Kf1]|nr:hypothetical protein [Xylophilus sp. Kf1]
MTSHSVSDSTRRTCRSVSRAALATVCMAGLAFTAGCASQRIAGSLERYGVPPDKAACVGDSLAERLSYAQLQALGKAAADGRKIDNSSVTMTLFDLARVATDLRDPVIPLEVVRAGVKCLVLPAQPAPARMP